MTQQHERGKKCLLLHCQACTIHYSAQACTYVVFCCPGVFSSGPRGQNTDCTGKRGGGRGFFSFFSVSWSTVQENGRRKWGEGGSHTGRSLPFLPLFRKGIHRVPFLSHLLNISIRRNKVRTKGDWEIRAFSMMCKIFWGAKQKAVIRGGKRKREKWLILGCGLEGVSKPPVAIIISAAPPLPRSPL